MNRPDAYDISFSHGEIYQWYVEACGVSNGRALVDPRNPAVSASLFQKLCSEAEIDHRLIDQQKTMASVCAKVRRMKAQTSAARSASEDEKYGIRLYFADVAQNIVALRNRSRSKLML